MAVGIVGWKVDNWPLSMAKLLDFYTIIFKSDGSNVDVYEAYCDTDNIWNATKVIENIGAVGTAFPVNIDFADFGWFYAMSYVDNTSGVIDVKCYYRDPDESPSTDALAALPTDACPEFMTCCNFKGQAIIGGIISTTADWTKLGKCSVAWGAINQFEFRPFQNRTAGYRRMPWSDWDEGVVNKVARLGDVVMVYGNGGKAALFPHGSTMAVGFGLRELVGPGVDKGFHVDGDKDLHGFISTENEFWVVSKDLEFKKLGYKEYIDAMQDENDAVAEGLPIVVSYSSYDKRFYISGYSSAYVLTEFGLYSSHQSVTSIGRYRGKVLCGFFKDLGDYSARFTSDTIDFKIRGFKTLDVLEYGVDYPSKGTGKQLAPYRCCTDPVDDENLTTGWTASSETGATPSMTSVSGGVEGYCLSLTSSGGVGVGMDAILES